MVSTVNTAAAVGKREQMVGRSEVEAAASPHCCCLPGWSSPAGALACTICGDPRSMRAGRLPFECTDLCLRATATQQQMEGNVATGGPVGRERKSFKYNRKKWENNDSCGRLAGRWPTAAANVASHQKCPVALMPSLWSQWWYPFQNNLILI